MFRLSHATLLFIYSFIGLPASTPGQQPRLPYVQNVTTTSVVIMWKADVTSAHVEYGTTPKLGSIVASGNTLYHEVTITTLSSNTLYYYQIYNDSQPFGDMATFKTAPATDATEVSFIAFGDSGVTQVANNTVVAHPRVKDIGKAINAHINTNSIDLLLHVGDVYQGSWPTEDLYQLIYFDIYGDPANADFIRFHPLYPTFGNHDMTFPQCATILTSLFSLPEGPGNEEYYSFNYANVHFICLQSFALRQGWNCWGDIATYRENMLAWLEADLATNDHHWTVVFFHYPVFSKGPMGDCTPEDELSMRNYGLHRIFHKYGVDLVLSGHHHYYTRTHSLVPSTILPAVPVPVTHAANATVYVVTGGGGGGVTVANKADTQLVDKVVGSMHHFTRVDASANTLRIRAIRAYPTALAGIVVDDYTIFKEHDCNSNGILDALDILAGTSTDFDTNGVPDECGPDCNGNTTSDYLDIFSGTSSDCNGNRVPDECESFFDCNANQISDICEADHNHNGVPDECDISTGASLDCDQDGIPDEVQKLCGVPDCNENGDFDACDIFWELSDDCNFDGIPDECQTVDNDCNFNDVPDDCELLNNDCNANSIPDECDSSQDCNENDIFDFCEIRLELEDDCNFNGIPDTCDIAFGTSTDLNDNFLPDNCEDCNWNSIPDQLDILAGTSMDCNSNSIPDECELDGPTISQWATTLIAVSSEYGSSTSNPPQQWSGAMALGEPDVPRNEWDHPNDHPNSWTPANEDDGVEFISVTYAVPVQATGAVIFENLNAGFVRKVEVIGVDSNSLLVWEGVDPCHVFEYCELNLSWSKTLQLVDGLRITINTEHFQGYWEEVDAIQLRGVIPGNGDLNSNGMPDDCDIIGGTSTDLNSNGIPDEAEAPFVTYIRILRNHGEVGDLYVAAAMQGVSTTDPRLTNANDPFKIQVGFSRPINGDSWSDLIADEQIPVWMFDCDVIDWLYYPVNQSADAILDSSGMFATIRNFRLGGNPTYQRPPNDEEYWIYVHPNVADVKGNKLQGDRNAGVIFFVGDVNGDGALGDSDRVAVCAEFCSGTCNGSGVCSNPSDSTTTTQATARFDVSLLGWPFTHGGVINASDVAQVGSGTSTAGCGY